MGVFSQLGDPLAAAACLCQHHGAAYAEQAFLDSIPPMQARESIIANGATLTSVQITITERCCVIVNAAMLIWTDYSATGFEIEQPLGTIVTSQRDEVITNEWKVTHHAAWEVLDPGTYTYYLVNRAGGAREASAAWIKAIASDCEG